MQKVRASQGEGTLKALLEEGTFFKGELRFRGFASIDGECSGKILGEGTLIIGSSAKVLANIQVDHLVLHGFLRGHIRAKKSVLMEAPARFEGEVQSPSLTIKDGVSFEGSSKKPEPQSER